eukprot:NODE_5270_length_1789_cov_4.465704.p1 GENE.NODE_5270_length_1789_cov_4.465704~~NODE_5270_length_1789_cov_4.465704.p1  ORF type:complete len:128 (-),score=17.45 NODE_5270_length_1789_cov_4.465704:1029-1412(-)
MNTRARARQGCRFGALLFNLQYARALFDLRAELQVAGLLTSFLLRPGAPPWCHAHGDGDEEQQYKAMDCTCVDDEAFMITAVSNNELIMKARTLFVVALRCLANHSLQLNWSPGKSELLIAWRGKGA